MGEVMWVAGGVWWWCWWWYTFFVIVFAHGLVGVQGKRKGVRCCWKRELDTRLLLLWRTPDLGHEQSSRSKGCKCKRNTKHLIIGEP